MTRYGADNDSATEVPWQSRFLALGNLRSLLALVWRANPTLFVLCIAIRIVRSAVPVTTLWVTKYVIDSVVGFARHGAGSALIWKLVALDAGVYLCGDILTRLSILTESILGDHFAIHTNVLLMEHTVRLDVGRFEDPTFLDRLERARQQAAGRLSLFASVLGFLQDTLGLLFLSSAISISSPWLLALLVIAILPSFLGEAKLVAMEYSILFRRTPLRRKLDYIRFLCASLHSVKEVSLFSLGRYLIDRYLAEWKEIYKENKAMAVRRSWTGGLLNVISTVGYYSGYVLILARTLNGTTTVGSFVFLTRSFSRCCNIIERLFSNVGSICDDSLLLGDLLYLFNVRPCLDPPRMNSPVPRPIVHGVEFRNVRFKYPGTEKWVLNNVSFSLESGQSVAIVGANGSGKTTIAKLLARLYDPSEGQIVLDGVDLRDYDLNDFQRSVTAVFQDYVRYDLTVLENIAFGDINKLGDLGSVEDAARKSQSDRLIASMPEGYGQMLGRRFEGGVDISGGEWQKLALARACMRDAQLWILDEPTAALDARAEYEWFMHFVKISKQSIALLISHRFSTIRMADKILVLANGTIREEGTHENLLALRGHYARMFDTQARFYR